MTIARAVAIALLGLAAEVLLVVAIDAGAIDLATWRLPSVLVVAVAAAGLASLVQRPAPPDPRLVVVAAWISAGIVLHYGVGIDPAWRGNEVRGLAHAAWDLLFHLPPVLLGGWAVQYPMQSRPEVT